MGLNAGLMNRQIVIERRTGAVDALGQSLDTWEIFATVWAYIKTQTGMATVRNAGPQGVVPDVGMYSFRIRYRIDVTSAMRVNINGIYYTIDSVKHDAAGFDWTDLVTRLGANDG